MSSQAPDPPLKPQFFVTRQNGNMVPLIAMDELPSTLSIRNVARSLSSYDVSGMTGIGTYATRHVHHVVEPNAAGGTVNRTGQTVDRSVSLMDCSGGQEADLGGVLNGDAPALVQSAFMGNGVTASNDRSLMALRYASTTGFEHVRPTQPPIHDIVNKHLTLMASRHADVPGVKTQRLIDDIMTENSPGTDINPRKTPNTIGIFPGPPPKAYGIHEQPPAVAGFPSPQTHNAQLSPMCQPTGPPSTAILTPNTPLTNNLTTLTPPPRPSRSSLPPSTTPQPLPSWHDISSHPHLQAVPGVKEYCSYWLRHGECDYAQQGCLYKHEMPLDKATLERLGHRDIPRWYREKHGLGSYLAANGAPASLDVGERALLGVGRKWEIMGKQSWRNGVGDARYQGFGQVGGRRGGRGGAGVVRLANTGLEVLNGTWDEAMEASSGIDPAPRNGQSKPQSSISVNGMLVHPTTKTLKLWPQATQSTEPMMTEKEKQLNRTIAELDAYEERERLRKETLQATIDAAQQAEAAAIAAGDTTTGSTSPASSHSSPSPIFDKVADSSSCSNSNDNGTPALTPDTSAGCSSESDEEGAPGPVNARANAALKMADTVKLNDRLTLANGSTPKPKVGKMTSATPTVKNSSHASPSIPATRGGPASLPVSGVGPAKKQKARRGSKIPIELNPRHHRRRLAPPSESGESRVVEMEVRGKLSKGQKGKGKEMVKEKAKKSREGGGKVDLLEGYDHSD